eukprot:gene5126-10250_t
MGSPIQLIDNHLSAIPVASEIDLSGVMEADNEAKSAQHKASVILVPVTESVQGNSRSYYRRPLAEPCVPFRSTNGRLLFQQALDQGFMECYFPLSEQFTTQSEPAFCGLASLTMALNALDLDPERIWKGVWRWFDETMLGECCEKREIVVVKGLTLSKVACLARCNGADTHLLYASDMTENAFRELVIQICSQKVIDTILIVSYNRAILNQTGSGHFSPLAAYHSEQDMVLIMDVARFKYPPHWVPLSTLFAAMREIDPETNCSRGIVLVSKGTIKQDNVMKCASDCVS